MSIEWGSVNQCSMSLGYYQVALLDNVRALSERSGWTRLLALPVGVSLACLTVASIITTIGEAIFKGLANIFGAPFSDELHFHKGVAQLFGDSIVAIPMGVAVGWTFLIIVPINLIYDPALRG